MGNHCTSKTQASGVEGEEETIYDKAKTRIAASLQYMKNCDDYSTKEAMLQINTLDLASGSCKSLSVEYKVKLAHHLVNGEFAQLFVKIVTSLQGGDCNRCDGGHKDKSLRYKY